VCVHLPPPFIIGHSVLDIGYSSSTLPFIIGHSVLDIGYSSSLFPCRGCLRARVARRLACAGKQFVHLALDLQYPRLAAEDDGMPAAQLIKMHRSNTVSPEGTSLRVRPVVAIVPLCEFTATCCPRRLAGWEPSKAGDHARSAATPHYTLLPPGSQGCGVA